MEPFTLMESRWNVETIRVQGDAFHLESINYVEKESIEVRIRNSTSTEIKLYEANSRVFLPLAKNK